MFLIMEIQRNMPLDEVCLWLLVTIISNISFSFLDIVTFISIFKIEASNRKVIISSLINATLKFITVLIIPIPYYRALNILYTVLVFKLFFKESIEKCVLGEVINTIIIASAEGVFSKIFCELFSNIYTYGEGMFNYKYKFCVTLSIGITRFIVYYVIKKKNMIIKIPDNIKNKNKLSIIISSILGMIIIFFNSVEMTMYISDFPYIIFVLDIASIIICMYISTRSLVRVSKLEEQDRIINNLEHYNQTLSIMYDSIRGFRHDFYNYVQALDGYVQINDIEGVRKMNQSILKDCKTVNNMAILNPNIINNPAIYSIVTNKYYLAQENNIEMNIEVMIDLTEVKISSYELCRILAILLDNAIEAAKECNEKVINLRFIKDPSRNRKLIIIENTYANKDIDIDKIFEKGFSTKESSDNKHGLGLWTVRRILNQNNNLNLFTQKGELFSQQLEIYE